MRPRWRTQGDSEDAAAAAAAYQVLLDILQPPVIAIENVPTVAARLQGYYNDSLAGDLQRRGVPELDQRRRGRRERRGGHDYFAERDGDGRYGNPSFSVGFEDGEWRPVVDGTRGQQLPVGRGHGSSSSRRCPVRHARTAGTSRVTRCAGIRSSEDARPGHRLHENAEPDQHGVVLGDHAVAMWTRFPATIGGQDLSTAENARFFGMLYLTGADALIACWADKEATHFWRPQTAIQEVDDGNPATVPHGVAPAGPHAALPGPPVGSQLRQRLVRRTLQQFFGDERLCRSARHVHSPSRDPHRSRGPSRDSPSRRSIPEIRRARVFAGAALLDRRRAGCAFLAGEWRTGGRTTSSNRWRTSARRGGRGAFRAPPVPSRGEGRNRTADTAVFSRVLYQLSYLPYRRASRLRLARPARPTGFDPAISALTGR